MKKVIFFSSGGTVYGKEVGCPLKEDTPTKPISSYGVQKITIEKLIYLYHYMYGIDYRIIRSEIHMAHFKDQMAFWALLQRLLTKHSAENRSSFMAMAQL